MSWLLIAGLAVAGRPTELTVRVLDHAGEPVPTATVRFEVDGWERHRVNPVSGAWTAEALYARDGSTLLMHKGLVLEAHVAAPGYRYHIQEIALLRRRRNETVVQLVPLDLTLEPPAREDAPATTLSRAVDLLESGHPDEAGALAEQASVLARRELSGEAFVTQADASYRAWVLAGLTSWRDAELELVVEPAADAVERTWTSRHLAIDRARTWLEWASYAGTDRSLAQEVCRVATTDPGECD